MASTKNAPKGGAFLVDDASFQDCFTPEDLSEEQRAIKASVSDFVEKALTPKKIDAIEKKEPGALLALFKEAGKLGFLGVEVPEKFGGLGLTLMDAALVFEAIGYSGNGSVSVTFGAHAGIGTFPLRAFGSDALRGKYLPGIAGGKLVAAYALTEESSGSDALGAKAKAVLFGDGKQYLVNGAKRFITNAGFADAFTVFVKVDGDKNAALLIERSMPGVSVGKEEHKLGLHGSSTCELVLQDVLVPVENVIGMVGKGHKVVFITLNVGRFDLAAAVVGGLKKGIDGVIDYALGRKQFDKSISAFDAIRSKFADVCVWTWVGESMVYRTGGLLSAAMRGAESTEAIAEAVEEYSVECALVKVALSEMLWDAVNHGVQVFGGNGYIEDYPAARALRDARINLIFEGTNEINRFLAVKEIGKRAMDGKVDLLGAYRGAGTELRESVAIEPTGGQQAGGFAQAKENLILGAAAARDAYRKVASGERGFLGTLGAAARKLHPGKPAPAAGQSVIDDALHAAKTAAVFALGAASLHFQQALLQDKETGDADRQEQQVLTDMADLLIWVYALDSSVARLRKHRRGGDSLEDAVVRAYMAATLPKLGAICGRVLIAAGKTDDALRCQTVLAQAVTRPEFDLIALRKRIGQAVVEKKKYPF
ncbi:acyl-CoA dehydrogenase family protein [Candidatus Uhrbacteria bacterium]|nr:acyl-CoA dehydrogenase family protein [Candidatus Uhrbacteria bacterium]